MSKWATFLEAAPTFVSEAYILSSVTLLTILIFKLSVHTIYHGPPLIRTIP